jgi:hypothetical protein
MGGKWPGGEADHSSPSSADVKECVELYLHSTNTPSWRGTLLKHKDNFTFTFIYLDTGTSPFNKIYCANSPRIPSLEVPDSARTVPNAHSVFRTDSGEPIDSVSQYISSPGP